MMRWIVESVIIPALVCWATVEVFYWFEARRRAKREDFKLLNPEDLRDE